MNESRIEEEEINNREMPPVVNKAVVDMELIDEHEARNTNRPIIVNDPVNSILPEGIFKLFGR